MGTRPHRVHGVRRPVIRAVAVAAVAGLGTLAPAVVARGGEVFWDGGAATSNWGDVANWSGDAPPGPADDVRFNDLVPHDEQFYATVHLGADRTVRNVFDAEDFSNYRRFTIGSPEDVAAGNALHLTGGRVEFRTFAPRRFIIASDVVLEADGYFQTAVFSTISGAVRDEGAGRGLSVASDLTLTGANTYSGPTVGLAQINLAGPDGSARNSPSFRLSSSLLLNNQDGANGDRVADTAAVTLRSGGSIALIGHASQPVTETVGDLVLNGGVVGIAARGAFDTTEPPATATLVAKSLARENHAVGFVTAERGGRVLLQTTPPMVGAPGAAGSTNLGILPFLQGDRGRPVTYDFGPDATPNTADDVGLRSLSESELAPFDRAGSADNARVDRTPDAPVEGKMIRSLVMTDTSDTGSAHDVNFTGRGQLWIESGLVSLYRLSNSSHVSIGGFDALNFGQAEAIFHNAIGDGPEEALVVASPVAGSGGLTKSGSGTVRLAGSHTYTGTTTIHMGTLAVETPSGLGLGGEGVVLDGTGPELNVLQSFATDRPITVRDGFAFLDVSQDKTLTLFGPVTLNGTLAKNGPGVLRLTYAGGGGGTPAGTLVVAQGTLLYENTSGPGVAANHVSVNSRATLGGTGRIGSPVQVNGGGILAPGRPGEVGSLATGMLILEDFSVLAFDLGAPGTGDHLQVDGPLFLDGQLRINPLEGFGPGTYRLIDYTGPMTDGGVSVSRFDTDAYRYRVDTSVPGQVNLVVTVPEPAAAGLLLLGAGALVRRRRRF